MAMVVAEGEAMGHDTGLSYGFPLAATQERHLLTLPKEPSLSRGML